MITANISKTKNELSRYLDAVRGGETVLILDRKRPIAEIRPLAAGGETGAEAQLDALEGLGLIRRPLQQPGDWTKELVDVSKSGNGPVGSVGVLLEERKAGR
jgi:antitoxin (DNA-binding transcriptional repressor) of toxin-antitoxin stability system